MTPFMAFLFVLWTKTPFDTNERSSIIYREVFPDREICEIAVQEQAELAAPLYLGKPEVKRIIAVCVPVRGKGA